MAEKCTHSCSDCAILACRSKDESKYPPFCLTGKVDIHVEAMAQKLVFVCVNVGTASDQPFFLRTEPDKFHSAPWSVCKKIPQKLHNDCAAGHVIVSARTLGDRVVVSGDSQNVVAFVRAFNARAYILGGAHTECLSADHADTAGALFYHLGRIQIMDTDAGKSSRFRGLSEAFCRGQPFFICIDRRSAEGEKATRTCLF